MAKHLGRVPIAGSVVEAARAAVRGRGPAGRRNRIGTVLVQPDRAVPTVDGGRAASPTLSTMPADHDAPTLDPSDPEDAKLVTLARSTRARTRRREGACVRDQDGRTYAGATVDLPTPAAHRAAGRGRDGGLQRRARPRGGGGARRRGRRQRGRPVRRPRPRRRRRAGAPGRARRHRRRLRASPEPTSGRAVPRPARHVVSPTNRGSPRRHIATICCPRERCGGVGRPRRRGGAAAGVVRRDPGRASRCGWPSAPRTCSGPGPPPRRPASTSPGSTASSRSTSPATAGAPPTCRACAPTSTSSTPPWPRGLIPLRRPAAAQHHPRRRGHRPRHRVDVVPQRAAARVGARDGRPHRRRRGRHAPGPASDLFDAFPNSYGSLGYATRLRIRLEPVPAYVDLRHVRFDDLDALAEDRRGDRRAGRARRRPGRRSRRRRVRAGGGLPDAGHLARRPAPGRPR